MLEVIGTNRVQISEKIKPGATILEFIGNDLDSKKLKYTLYGSKQGLENFKIQEVYLKLYK